MRSEQLCWLNKKTAVSMAPFEKRETFSNQDVQSSLLSDTHPSSHSISLIVPLCITVRH